MPINMTDYRMIINERVYNVLQIMIDFAGPLEEGEPPKPECAGYISRRKRK